jgi:hypothetical protein
MGDGAMLKSNANQATATASVKSTVVHVNFAASGGAAERLAAGPHNDIDQIVNRLREEMSWSSAAIPPLAEALKPGAPAHIVADSARMNLWSEAVGRTGLKRKCSLFIWPARAGGETPACPKEANLTTPRGPNLFSMRHVMPSAHHDECFGEELRFASDQDRGFDWLASLRRRKMAWQKARAQIVEYLKSRCPLIFTSSSR